jgi:crotonobetaine/carnitine-CoA ligase
MIPFREAFDRRFGMTLVTAYGQTETSFVTYDTPGDWRDGSCGRPAPGFQVAVVDPADRALPAGESGEIVVRPEDPYSMCSGYHGMPEQTVAASRNLWWHSGDSGHFDADGWLYFDGRIKDIIRRRGVNISAHEVESAVDEHPAVLESAAIAVPSELSEDEIKVVVVVRHGLELTHDELVEHCASRLPRHMVPRYVELRSTALPRTSTEKIAKEALRADGVTADTFDREKESQR